MIIYHNPRCSKCREALDLLNENKCDIEIREYLKEPPSRKELKELVKKLNVKPEDIVRKSEPLYKEEYKDKKITGTQWLKILSENPILIERPIVIDGEKAVIGRPPVLVLDLVKKKNKK
jgi:arsenate reductase (glutaredoxin)